MEGTMHMKVELPDEIENVSSRFCRECGRYLAYVQGEPDYVTQKIDLPPITPIYYERRFNKMSAPTVVATVIMPAKKRR